MRNELKYFFYLISIFIFLIFVVKYYFSDENKKNSFRAIEKYSIKIEDIDSKLITLNDNTVNIIEFVEDNLNQNKKKYNFWELLKND